jgi:tetratricopeptide (TPR) repeat protein/predicted Ser/Thr protein kinase
MAAQGTASLLAGRYRVVRPLGSGGMASVFLCEDERLGRLVAVKRLHAHSPDDVAQRFAREARLGASLNHPNLVSVYDTLTDDEAVVIVMEYVEGETLREVLNRGPLSEERALGVVRDVAHALDHAHSQGVVHRDVKPANILLRKDGVVKLVDLGIAKAADVTNLTASGMVLGTASYMAPEQLDGQEAGPAADVYALATVAFEALAGRKAYMGRTPMEIAHKVATESPPRLEEAWPDAPPAVAEALRRGMAKAPTDRPSSARDLCTALDRAMEESRSTAPSAAPRAGPRRRGRRPLRPGESTGWRVLAPAGAVLALAAAAVTLILLSGGGGEDSHPSGKAKAQQPKQQAAKPKGGAPAQPATPAAPGQPPPSTGGAGGSGGSGTSSGSGSGAALNSQGYRLMKAGRYDEAVPVLRRAVDAYPAGSSDLQYAYALYNLGRSLRLAGHPDQAIPVLERRLRIPNQTGTVRRELELARRQAASG